MRNEKLSKNFGFFQFTSKELKHSLRVTSIVKFNVIFGMKYFVKYFFNVTMFSK